MRPPRHRSAGFTLLELLVALAIFSLVAAMAAGTFWGVMRAWNRGGELLEQLHYGEFTMEQLVTALRGAAWFPSKPEAYGFWLESGRASWVTSGSAFLPPDSPYRDGLHRLSVAVDSAAGERGFVVRAWPHVSEEMDENDVEPWLICPEVEEFDCEWYDFEAESWSRDWEETNSLPKLVRVTLTMKKRKDFDEHLVLQRLVELEVAPELPAHEDEDRTTDLPDDEESGEESPGEDGGDGEAEPAPRAGGGKVTLRHGGEKEGEE